MGGGKSTSSRGTNLNIKEGGTRKEQRSSSPGVKMKDRRRGKGRK